jgi:hypothetical protein
LKDFRYFWPASVNFSVHADTEAEADEKMQRLVRRLQEAAELHGDGIMMEHAREVMGEDGAQIATMHDLVVFATPRQPPVLEDVIPLECCPAGERATACG